MSAARLDPVVEKAVLSALSSPAVAIVEEIVQGLRQERNVLASERDAQLQRARRALAEAEQRYDQAGDEHPRLRRRLAERYDEALHELDRVETLQRQQPLVEPPTLSPAELTDLEALLPARFALWH